MKSFTFFRGKHRSGLFFRPFLFCPKLIHVEFLFNENSRYELKFNHFQINKLFGYNLGLPGINWEFNIKPFEMPYFYHRRSIRLGWRYLKDKDRMELLIYSYVKDDNPTHIISITKNILLSKKYSGLIDLDNKKLIIKDEDGYELANNNLPNLNCNRLSFGYYLMPYFGGIEPAPKRIDLMLDYKSKR